jgi:hypothetical protein
MTIRDSAQDRRIFKVLSFASMNAPKNHKLGIKVVNCGLTKFEREGALVKQIEPAEWYQLSK